MSKIKVEDIVDQLIFQRRSGWSKSENKRKQGRRKKKKQRKSMRKAKIRNKSIKK